MLRQIDYDSVGRVFVLLPPALRFKLYLGAEHKDPDVGLSPDDVLAQVVFVADAGKAVPVAWRWFVTCLMLSDADMAAVRAAMRECGWRPGKKKF